MILYLESSAALAWLLGEPAQHEVLALLRQAEQVVCSRLTLVETDRALHVAGATRRMTLAAVNKARQAMARARQQWAVLEISERVCNRATQRFPKEPVRALDAIHLGSLLELHGIEPRIQPVTLDQRVRDNALLLGFQPLP